MFNITRSPTSGTSIEQKLKAKQCALILKNGSPKLRDLLRDRCHFRMKESRADAFNSSRDIQVGRNVRLINKIVLEELAQEVDNDIDLQENIMKEILENWDQWQSEEFEKSMEYMMDVQDDVEVFCPVCQRNLLSLEENIISCNCGLRLYYSKTLPEFYEKIQSNLKTHDLNDCFEKLTFFTEPKVGFNVLALNAICQCCEYYAPIVELL